MESVLVPASLEALKCVGGPIARRISYLKALEDNMEILKRKRDELEAKESDINTKLQIAEEQSNETKPLEEVTLWMKNVERAKIKVGNIERSFEEHKNRSRFSNIYSRFKLAKLVVEVIQQVGELQERQFPEGHVISKSTHVAVSFDPPCLSRQHTAEKTMNKIMKLLQDRAIRKIGVYGMGGVGKTTIMKNVHDKLMKSSQFDRIIWITVSKDMGSIETLQNRIAQEIDSHNFGKELASCEDKVRRAAILSDKLKRCKNLLLILDDVWQEITLEEVGIPEPNARNNCKIVLTTRLLPVCDSMETQSTVEVNCLSDEEAWELFVSKNGNQVLSTSEFKQVAKEVVRQCGGLPLAIVTIGRAMRRKRDIRDWRHTLDELRSSKSPGTTGMEKRVFKILRYSYNHLRTEVQKCFLYCAFYPEDHQIQPYDLVEYWVAEGYMDVERSEYVEWDREVEINKGFMILQELKDACLLETVQGSRESEHVKMHDLVRDLAIKIMRDELGYVSKTGLNLTELAKETWKTANKISLMRNEIRSLPDQLNCPNLSTLLLRRNPYSSSINTYSSAPEAYTDGIDLPENFFSQMLALRVLDLSECNMTMLPTSISHLTNLRALFLRDTHVEGIPSLEKLKELQLLNLHNSHIQDLSGMDSLTKLRFLDLTDTIAVRNLQANMIAKLTLLEDLRVGDVKSGCIQEMAHLKHLVVLHMSLWSYNVYLEVISCIQWNSLKKFKIHTFGSDDQVPQIDDDETKALSMCHLNLCIRLSSFRLPDNTELLCFSNCTIPALSTFHSVKNLKFLKKLYLESGKVPGNCLFTRDEMYQNLFVSLEKLSVCGMDGLGIIWDGEMPIGCFANLKVLIVAKCNGLKDIFSISILQQLKSIEVIKVSFCREMEEIVASTEGAHTKIVLPKLHTVFLRCIPELYSISSRNWTCDSLKNLVIWECPRIKELPFESLPSLENIYGSEEWWNTLQWDKPTSKTLFQPFFKAVYRYHDKIEELGDY
ncbi:hypothetical protein Sjap_011792 [Stephania japonica]|uniref:AAA+ ATPase domain-containing protein n=1 Tax=Stephania japonica TaxID=461633 RepID=A0AAP0P7Q3_9MAGN